MKMIWGDKAKIPRDTYESCWKFSTKMSDMQLSSAINAIVKIHDKNLNYSRMHKGNHYELVVLKNEELILS